MTATDTRPLAMRCARRVVNLPVIDVLGGRVATGPIEGIVVYAFGRGWVDPGELETL